MTGPGKVPPSKTADRMLQVLSLFLQVDGPLGVTELSRASGLDKSVVHRSLVTLVHHGYLEQDPSTRKYSIGVRSWELGQRYTLQSWVADAAVPLLSEVLVDHGSTGYVARLDGTDIIYLAAVDGAGPFQVSVKVGSRTSAATTALGIAILASLSESELESTLDKINLVNLQNATTGEPIRRETLVREIVEARKNGYATNRGMDRTAVGAVGAALVDTTGSPVAGISIAFPIMSDFENLWRTLPAEVCRVAAEVSKRL